MTSKERPERRNRDDYVNELSKALTRADEAIASITKANISDRFETLLKKAGVPLDNAIKTDATRETAAHEADDETLATHHQISEAMLDISLIMSDSSEECSPLSPAWRGIQDRESIDTSVMSINHPEFENYARADTKDFKIGPDASRDASSVGLDAALLHLQTQIFTEQLKLATIRREVHDLQKAAERHWKIFYEEQAVEMNAAFERAEMIESMAREMANKCHDQALDELEIAKTERRQARHYAAETASRRKSSVSTVLDELVRCLEKADHRSPSQWSETLHRRSFHESPAIRSYPWRNQANSIFIYGGASVPQEAWGASCVVSSVAFDSHCVTTTESSSFEEDDRFVSKDQIIALIHVDGGEVEGGVIAEAQLLFSRPADWYELRGVTSYGRDEPDIHRELTSS